MELTQGCVLYTSIYKESDFIVGIFTKDFGWISYKVRGYKKKKNSLSITLFRPLILLEIQAKHSLDKQKFIYFKQVDPLYTPTNLYQSQIKLQLSFCITEVLRMCLRYHPQQENLYDFIIFSIQWLDQTLYYANFFNVFLLKLLRILGFGLSLTNITFLEISPSQQQLFIQCNTLSYQDLSSIKTNSSDRRSITAIIFDIYKEHIPYFKVPKSWRVIQQIYS